MVMADSSYYHLYVALDDYMPSLSKATVLHSFSSSKGNTIGPAISSIQSELSEDEVEFHQDLYSLIKDIYENPEDIQLGASFAFEEPYWEKFLLKEGEVERYVYGLPLAASITENGILLHLVATDDPLRFPSYVDISASAYAEAVFVPMPDDYTTEDNEAIIGDDFAVYQISETENGKPVFGYYPWDFHPLPTIVAYYCNTHEIGGPVLIVLPPPPDGDLSKPLRKALGSETLGLSVLVAYADVVYDDEGVEEEEE